MSQILTAPQDRAAHGARVTRVQFELTIKAIFGLVSNKEDGKKTFFVGWKKNGRLESEAKEEREGITSQLEAKEGSCVWNSASTSAMFDCYLRKFEYGSKICERKTITFSVFCVSLPLLLLLLFQLT